jgi:hypothetical protein
MQMKFLIDRTSGGKAAKKKGSDEKEKSDFRKV